MGQVGRLYDFVSQLPELITRDIIKLCANDANDPDVLGLLCGMDLPRPTASPHEVTLCLC